MVKDSRLVRLFFVALGLLFVGLGALGAFLPVLPTVPFLLCALYCFKRGSVRINNWFMRSSLYQKHLKEFDEKRAMTLRTKIYLTILSDTMMWITFFVVNKLLIRVVILILFVIKYWFFFVWIKILPPSSSEEK